VLRVFLSLKRVNRIRSAYPDIIKVSITDLKDFLKVPGTTPEPLALVNGTCKKKSKSNSLSFLFSSCFCVFFLLVLLSNSLSWVYCSLSTIIMLFLFSTLSFISFDGLTFFLFFRVFCRNEPGLAP
jgi:hypothetical protein